jgi:hypothetical protein
LKEGGERWILIINMLHYYFCSLVCAFALFECEDELLVDNYCWIVWMRLPITVLYSRRKSLGWNLDEAVGY